MVAIPVVKLSLQQWSEAADLSKRYRKIHGLTQGSLAAILNCTNQQISTIERGAPGGSSRIAAEILKLSILHTV